MTWNRFLLGLILTLNVFLLYRVVFSDHGIFAYRELKTRYVELEEKIQVLNDVSLELSQEIRLLKSDRRHIEQIIRQQMNFVKEDETVYVFPSSRSEASTGVGSNEDEN